jgi:hypothetical protein
MGFQIVTAVFDANNTQGVSGGGTNLAPLITGYQVATCGGVPIGTPTPALQVVAINKLQAAICNPESIIGTHNTPSRKILTNGQTVIIPAGQMHSIAFKVLVGNSSIKIGPHPLQTIDVGEADSWTASTLIDQDFEFTCNIGKLVITTIGSISL